MPDRRATPSRIHDHAETARKLAHDLMVQTHRELGKCISDSRNLIAESRQLLADADRLLAKRSDD